MEYLPYALAFLFCVLQVADFVSTKSGLNAGLVEANPIVKKALILLGETQALVAIKAIAVCVVLWFTYTGVLITQVGVVVLAIVDIFYILVVGNNIRLILERRK